MPNGSVEPDFGLAAPLTLCYCAKDPAVATSSKSSRQSRSNGFWGHGQSNPSDPVR